MTSPFDAVHRPGSDGCVIRQPIAVFHMVGLPEAGHALAGFSTTYGARLIDSTPPASTMRASPDSIALDPCTTASTEEPHRRLTVTPDGVRTASTTKLCMQPFYGLAGGSVSCLGKRAA